MWGVDGKLIKRGDSVMQVFERELHLVEAIDEYGIYITKNRFVPWYVVRGTWRKVGRLERISMIMKGR